MEKQSHASHVSSNEVPLQHATWECLCRQQLTEGSPVSSPARPRVNPANTNLQRCSLCALLVGQRRKPLHCSCCGAVMCRYCAVDSEHGRKDHVWCGRCELPRSLSLAQSSSMFPSKVTGDMRSRRAASEPSNGIGAPSTAISQLPVAAPPSTSTKAAPSLNAAVAPDSKHCHLCGAEFGFFSSRRKSFCCICRQVVCDACSSRATNRTRPLRRNSTSSPFDSILAAIQDTTDARACRSCWS